MTATWGQCLQYTTKVRWRHLRSAKTNAINANHITNACGSSSPMKNLSKASWWMEFIADQKEVGRNTSMINRIISACRVVFETTLRYIKPTDDALRQAISAI